jgi:hypothetical protein
MKILVFKMYALNTRNTVCLTKMALQFHINATLSMLKSIYTNPTPDKRVHDYEVAFLTKKFKGLLAQKARKESLNQVSDDNRSHPENTCACETDDTRPSIRIRDILKQKIARCG